MGSIEKEAGVNRKAAVLARVLVAVVFLLNGAGVIDQSIPAHELVERGAPAAVVPAIMLSGRVLELVAGSALALGILPELAALALLAFLIPATFVSHSFWEAWGTAKFQVQMINFFKNVAIWGGLLFLSATETQPALIPLTVLRDKLTQFRASKAR